MIPVYMHRVELPLESSSSSNFREVVVVLISRISDRV